MPSNDETSRRTNTQEDYAQLGKLATQRLASTRVVMKARPNRGEEVHVISEKYLYFVVNIYVDKAVC